MLNAWGAVIHQHNGTESNCLLVRPTIDFALKPERKGQAKSGAKGMEEGLRFIELGYDP